MSLVLHNTQSGKKETFKPIDPNRVTMYVCGPTVYNFIHIGNARPIVVFDTLFRLLQLHYPQVVYARNITDVDDKINQAAKENNESIRTLTDRYIALYHEDIAALNTLPPTIEPRATEHIEAMIKMVKALVDKGHAYEAEGHVLFDIESMPEYGELSHRKLDDMLAGARVDVAGYKRHAGDFVLWKPSSDDLPGWDSPWGTGRPGWHLECSTMIEQHLGRTIDIHGGGRDLIFPHHENERAQSQCAHDGDTFANYWVHNGYITVSGEKMSKSEGNFFTLRDVLEVAPGEAVRFALLSGHYRSPLDWSPENLKQARSALDGLYNALLQADEVEAPSFAEPDEAFVTALDDDLNTPVAIARLHDLARRLNKAESAEEKSMLKGRLLASGQLLGLFHQQPDAWFKWQPESGGGMSDDEIDALVKEREVARKERDFARADEIRDIFQAEGIALEDSPEGTLWKRG
ncbi:MAG TPA: cysteine--tRNA ligase [Gammaproteobacteria bacterium]|nr:cysteine--tRNA ligase [Gammaproteobacteria bacterium]